MFPKYSKQKIAAVLTATLVIQLGLPAQAATARYIKMRAHVGNIKAQAVTLPNGEVVDFPYVANALFYSQVFSHGYFEQSNFLEEVLEETERPATALVNGELTKALVTTESSDDVALLKQYGMGHKPSSSYDLPPDLSMKAGTEEPTNPFKVPRCQYNQPPVKLRGQVVAYEQNFGGGISAGYNSDGAIKVPGNISGSVSFKSTRLDMQFDAVDPLFSRTNQEALIASVPVKKNVFDVNGSVKFVIGIPIGIDFFFKSSIVGTLRSAMTNGLDTVITELLKQVGVWEKKKTSGSWKDIWESRVIDSPLVDNDDYVAIAGGKRAYVQVGDQFHIKNMFWDWAGKPCESRLGQNTMASAFFGEAMGEVIEVGNYVSILKITPLNGHEQAIKPGAYVTISKLK